MNPSTLVRTEALLLRNLISWLPWQRAFLLVALASFALSPTTHAVSPPPDGGYPFHNTAEGSDALFKNTTGSNNTATGDSALGDNTTGGNNTATGFEALLLNTTGNENTANGFEALISNTTG